VVHRRRCEEVLDRAPAPPDTVPRGQEGAVGALLEGLAVGRGPGVDKRGAPPCWRVWGAVGREETRRGRGTGRLPRQLLEDELELPRGW